MKVVVIGIGLIGGSMVLDIKALHPEATILGMDANENHLQQAIDLGVVEKAGTTEDLADADFVIVSVPVDIALVVLPQVLDAVGENTIVFEVGSTKLPICEAVANHPKRRNYIATHHQELTIINQIKTALALAAAVTVAKWRRKRKYRVSPRYGCRNNH